MKASLTGLSRMVLALLATAGLLLAEEKNGVQLTVVKKTLDRNDVRGSYYYTDRIDRTQGLKVTIKNVSFKPMPEGEVEWTIVVRKYYSSVVEGFTGVEKLKALRPADTEQMVMGAAQITGWAGYYDAAKDKIEYQVIVKQGGAETIRTQSSASFDALAKRARIKKVAAANPEEAGAGAPAGAAPATRKAATPVPAR
ncbi:MAG TPA: hypothetical protein VGO90_14590 [Chthoniobacteraceae bacterium]|jgi:hypothetical protein|nr:hypothetical protein [Chthoniobacter sp.]HEV7868912.1 hypothetical protein [Chthoniobacteraceae bacterium]